MRLLVLNPILFTSTDGSLPKVKTIKDTMIYGMCIGFKNLGYEVTLVALQDYHPTHEENYDFDVVWMKGIASKYLTDALPLSLEMWRWLKIHHIEYDLVVSSEVFAFHSLFAALICPQKTIIWQELTTHQNKFYQLPSKLWHHIVAKFFMKNIKVVIPRSTKAYEFIRKFMPMTTSIVVDHGINIRKFQCSEVKNRQIISSSQLIYRKNVDGIIRCFARFHQMKGYEDIKLLIAGRGDEEIALKSLVSRLGIDDAVVFLGFMSQSKLNEYIRESMCFLVNTRKDLNMVSIPESIVSGTPILTNLQPASADYIAREHLGIAKEKWDEDDIRKIIDNNSKYVFNCLKYRSKLTCEYSANMLVKLGTCESSSYKN